MKPSFSIAQFDEAAEAVRQRSKLRPRIGLILGSGLNPVADAIGGPVVIPFSQVPHFPKSTVVGHAGRLLVGKLHDREVLIMQGRVHFYEGYSMQEITLPIRMMQRLGIEILIVTNAAGGLNPEFQVGDVMLITDQLNFLGMTGNNPLIGPNHDEIGPRFPDMSQAYDRELAQMAREAAVRERMTLREGVYAGLSGPSFEGPADSRFLRLAGADAVGMSTVHEVIVARHGGLRVLGFSGISNKASLDGSTATTHEEVIETGKILGGKIERLIAGVLPHVQARAMAAIYQFLGTHEVLVYILLSIGGLFGLRWLWRSWNEWRLAVYSLEREFALRRIGRSVASLALILVLFLAELITASFIFPGLPASMFVPTATPDLLATPTGTISAELATAIALTPRPAKTLVSGDGCVAETLDLVAPRAEQEVRGSVEIRGTVNIPDFGFYKYEVAPKGSEAWATIAAGRETVINGTLGQWDTSSMPAGEYQLRLVVTDNQGRSLDACVITIRVVPPA